MTSDQLDQVHAKKEEISKKVSILVNALTKDLDPEIDRLVRLQLTESYRFWRPLK